MYLEYAARNVHVLEGTGVHLCVNRIVTIIVSSGYDIFILNPRSLTDVRLNII